jgi:capsular exopolysaccharide synthesis family protein
MNSLYGQTSNPMMNVGMMPYGTPMPGMGGGDSLFQIAWKGKWLILLFALLGLGGGYGYYRFLMPKEFTSISRVLVDKPRGPTGPTDIMQPGTSASSYLQQQVGILLSSQVIGAAFADSSVLSLASLSVEGRREALRSSLSARVGKDEIINVTASSEDSKEPPAIINAVVNQYIEWHKKNKTHTVESLLDSLRTQAKETLDNLTFKRGQLTLLAERDNILETTEDSAVSKSTESLRRDLATAKVYTIEQQSFCERLRKLQSDPNRFRQYVLVQGRARDDAERNRATEDLYATQLKLGQLLSAGGPVEKALIAQQENKKKELVAKIAKLDEAFVREQMEDAEAVLAYAKERETYYQTRYDEEMGKLRSSNAARSKYEALRDECDMLRLTYTTTLKKINDLDLNAPWQGLSIHVLEEAQEGKSPPSQTAKIMGIGLILGLMTGGGLAFLRDMKDLRVRSADEITAILGVPILGAVPTIPRRGLLRRGPRTRLSLNSRESEAYRSIRTALFFGSSNEEGKTLLVTSPGALEGKTTLVSNLGVAMAHAGQRTLIIDADLRKPMQHRVFARGGRGKGVIDVLSGAMTLDEAIRHTEIEGLDVLESGQPVPNPSELLSSDAFAALIEQVKGRYDRILVDSPPVGVVADAQILAARCGLTLLVLRAERSSRITTQRARDALSTVSAKVVGAVVNDVHKRDTRYSHHGYGAYSYYHSAHAAKGEPAVRKELPATVDQKPQGDSSAPAKKKK